MMVWRVGGPGVLFAVALVGLGVACGSTGVGVGACRQIEEARCREAPPCKNIVLEPPWSTSGTDVDACIRYYDDACFHGLEVPNPSTSDVNACVAAIDQGNCAIVAAPQDSPACAWLIPAGSDAGATVTTSDASDAATEAAQ